MALNVPTMSDTVTSPVMTPLESTPESTGQVQDEDGVPTMGVKVPVPL